MKKIYVVITVILVLFLAYLSLKYMNTANLPIVITFGVLLMLLFSYLYFEKSRMGTKEIALIATLSTLAAVCRAVFEPLPNIKPTTFMVAVSGYVFGPYTGFLIGSTTAFLSNIFLGQGPWTPWQMVAWGLVGFISGILGKNKRKMSALRFSLLCFFYGFMFDWIMNLWHVLGFVRPITVKTVLLAYLFGLTFDVLHAGSSFIFSIIFYDKFLKVLLRFKKRMDIQYINEGDIV